jgi:transposase
MSRPSDLTDELTFQIRNLVLEGFMYKDIQSQLDISSNTWDTWVYRDTQGFRDNLIKWRNEKLLKKAEKISNEILDMGHVSDEGRVDSNILRVKQKESEFVRETVGKDFGYSKRSELTGKNGGSISVEAITGMKIIPEINGDSIQNKE